MNQMELNTGKDYQKIKSLILSEDTANIRLGLELMCHFPTQAQSIKLLIVAAVVCRNEEDIQESVHAQLQKMLAAQQAGLLWETLKSFLQNFSVKNSQKILYTDLLNQIQKFDFLDFNELCNIFLSLNHALLPYCIEKQTESLPNLMRLAVHRDNRGVVLDLGYCKLNKIPVEIGEFQELNYLNISGNRLQKLPDEMAQLKNLVSLNFDYVFFERYIPNLSPENLLKLEKWFPSLMAKNYYNHCIQIFDNEEEKSQSSFLYWEALYDAAHWIKTCIRLDPSNEIYHRAKDILQRRMYGKIGLKD